MSKKVRPQDVPFGITNAVLAYALDLAGVPRPEKRCSNLYSPDILFDLGGGKKDSSGNVTQPSQYADMDPDDAARAALADELAGSVRYYFQLVPELKRLCKAFTDQEEKLKPGSVVDPAKMLSEIHEQVADGTMDRQEGIIREAVVILKTYIPFKREWLTVVPLMKIPNQGRSETRDSTDASGNQHRVVKAPGAKIYSLNISAEKREKLGLNSR